MTAEEQNAVERAIYKGHTGACGQLSEGFIRKMALWIPRGAGIPRPLSAGICLFMQEHGASISDEEKKMLHEMLAEVSL